MYIFALCFAIFKAMGQFQLRVLTGDTVFISISRGFYICARHFCALLTNSVGLVKVCSSCSKINIHIQTYSRRWASDHKHVTGHVTHNLSYFRSLPFPRTQWPCHGSWSCCWYPGTLTVSSGRHISPVLSLHFNSWPGQVVMSDQQVLRNAIQSSESTGYEEIYSGELRSSAGCISCTH